MGKIYNAMQLDDHLTWERYTIQCDARQHNTIQYNTSNTKQQNTIQHSKIQYNTPRQLSRLLADLGAVQCNSMTIVHGKEIEYNAIQDNTIQYNTRHANKIQNKHNAIQYNTLPYNTIPNNTIQHSTTHYYTTQQYNTIQQSSRVWVNRGAFEPIYEHITWERYTIQCISMTILHGKDMQDSAIKYHTPQYNTIHAIQNKTTQHNTIQYNTI